MESLGISTADPIETPTSSATAPDLTSSSAKLGDIEIHGNERPLTTANLPELVTCVLRLGTRI